MPQFEINSNLLDYLMSVCAVKESRFNVAMESINLSFGVFATNIGSLTGLPHHGDDVVKLHLKLY